MTYDADALTAPVKQFILTRFLPGEDPRNLGVDTPLITGGVLDSLGTLDLVAFIEQQYGVELGAQDVDATKLDTLSRIATLVREKQATP
ncbi:MAG: acyl carrier protein [Gemmatimonadetes bacterium]|nr:acyl carrier protein [Gemmatimonadota bacterium]